MIISLCVSTLHTLLMLKDECFFPVSPFVFWIIYIFSLSSDQIGLSPEEVISKIMANPDVAMAFQNPRVQAAIMDVSSSLITLLVFQYRNWVYLVVLAVFTESTEYCQISKW